MDDKEPNTYFKGSEPINGIGTTAEIEIISAAYLPYNPELGDHRPVVTNISKRSLVGDKGPRIQKAPCRRLNSKVERIRQEYMDRFEEQMQNHKVLDRLQRLQEEADGEFGDTSRRTLNRLDQEMTEMISGTERKCRKLYRGAYEFSPEVKGWIEKGRTIQGLLRHRQTGAGNGGNARRASRRAGLQDLQERHGAKTYASTDNGRDDRRCGQAGAVHDKGISGSVDP